MEIVKLLKVSTLICQKKCIFRKKKILDVNNNNKHLLIMRIISPYDNK